jgi:exopolyphosphatase/guanosine-5'-triphosphate,3'-diphosphate pyrophosphatase
MKSRESSGSEEERVRKAVEQASALMNSLGSDPLHARQVTKLSLQLFDQLQKIHGFGEWERALLQVAALLHDVGLSVEKNRHHKHSARLIRDNLSKLPSLMDEEVELVAQVARYHRKADPTKRHRAFGALSSSERNVVCCLAALLRVADVLDRNHLQDVKGVQCQRSRGRIHIRLEGHLTAPPEETAFARKTELFNRIYGMPVEFSPPIRLQPNRLP